MADTLDDIRREEQYRRVTRLLREGRLPEPCGEFAALDDGMYVDWCGCGWKRAWHAEPA